MKTIEQILSKGNPFKIDNMVCMQHAEYIKAYKRPIESHKWTDSPLPVQLGFKVAFISICHQFNWDYMQNSLANALLPFGDDLPQELSKVSSKTVSEWLKDYPKQERVRAVERAKLLRNVGDVLNEKYNGDLAAFYKKCSSAKLEAGEFHDLMQDFEGYATDPLQKKTNVLSHDLLKENIIKFQDEKYIKPAIDYHIMRLYLRTGRVVASDQGVYKFLKGAPNPRTALVKHLRETVGEAEELVAYYASLNVADVNYIEWQIGRSICLNTDPVCQHKEKDIDVPEDILSLCDSDCPYRKVCWAVNLDLSFIELEEPNYVSTNY